MQFLILLYIISHIFIFFKFHFVISHFIISTILFFFHSTTSPILISFDFVIFLISHFVTSQSSFPRLSLFPIPSFHQLLFHFSFHVVFTFFQLSFRHFPFPHFLISLDVSLAAFARLFILLIYLFRFISVCF